MKKLLQLLCFFLTFANKNIDILIKSFFMGKFLQLKRCLAATVIALLGVTATWADAVVLYESNFSTDPATDGWTAVDKSTKTGKTWEFKSNGLQNGATDYNYGPAVRIMRDWNGLHNDYYVSPAMELTAGTKYTITTATVINNNSTITFEVGTSKDDMTKFSSLKTLAGSTLNYKNDGMYETIEYTPSTSGTFYFAYHAVQTEEGSGNAYLCGLKVTYEGTVTPGPDPDPEPGVDNKVFSADFSTQPTDWTIIDNSKSKEHAWNWNASAFYDGNSYTNKPAYRILQTNLDNSGSDDYLISPALQLTKGKYKVTASSARQGDVSATLTLECGKSNTDMTANTVVGTLTPALTYTDDRNQTFELNITEDGTYYLSYHVYEDPNMEPTARKQKTFVFGLDVEKDASAPQPAVTPAAVTNLAAAVDYAASTVTLTWTNPTKDAEGNNLTEKVGAKIYKNGELMETIDELTGETTTKELKPTPFEGEATFAVKAFIGEKESEEVSAKVNMTKPVIIPAAVTNFDATVDYDAATVTLTWTNPTKDASGKELTEKVGAKIYKDEVLVETIDELTGATTTKVLSPTPFEGEATFAVKTFIGEKESEAVSKKVDLTKPVPPVTAEEIPYTADLTKAETVATFKTIDANNDGITWTTVEGLNGLTYDSDDAKVAANDWAITPIIKFEADKNYAVAANFTRSGAFDEDVIDVYAGDEPTADKMTTKIGTFKIEDNAAEAKLRFIVAEEGNKYIGFHVVTPGSGDNGQLSLASVSITALEKATPLAVENLEGTVNSDDKTVTLTWTNPTKDTEGYPIAETLGVKLYENDVLVKTVDDASEGTLVYSPENFSGETTYKVVPFIGAKDGEGATVTLNLNDLTGDLVLVKAFEFNKTAATSWTIINADKNSSKWEFDYDGFYFGGGSAADDWLISPALALNTKDRYVLKYELKTAWQPSNNTFFADIDVTVGQGATAEAQTTTVSSHKGLSQNGFAEFQTKQFSVAADGQYNIGFHMTGIKGNANMRNLAVYAVGEATNSITEITEGGVVAYNKSNGALFVPAGSKVALYAANGTMAMQTVADGNAISLNSLANGIYVMKITSAEGKVMTQKIVK